MNNTKLFMYDMKIKTLQRSCHARLQFTYNY